MLASLGRTTVCPIRSLTQEDPLGLAGGLNLYGFANGDPVNFSDPFGLCPPADQNRTDCTVHLNGARLANPTFRGTLERFARLIGRNVELNGSRSGDRTVDQQKDLNSNVPVSDHMRHLAADIHVDDMSDDRLATAAANSGLFHGVEYSLGLQDENGSSVPGRGPHVHVDEGKKRTVYTEEHDGSTRTGIHPEDN